MHPQFPVGSSSSSYTEQSMTSGHGETEEEMQRMLQFLDASIITPPSANESSAQQAPQHQHSRAQPLQPQQQLTAEQLRELAAIHEAEGGSIYNELGEVIDLLGSLDANDTDPALLHHQDATFGAVLQQQQQQQQQQQRYSEMGTASIGGNTATGLTPTDFSRTPTTMTSTGGDVVHLPRSTSVSSSHSVADNISPVGLLGGPSMSPATINWLQSLVPSTSSDSLSGLISPATLYSIGGGSASGIGGIAGNTGGCASADGGATRTGGIPRTPSCEIIDWKAYNDTTEKPEKESAKWRVIPQHGPHADPEASARANSSTGTSFGKVPPGVRATESSRIVSTVPGSSESSRTMQMGDNADDGGGLRTHLTRQFQTIKSTVVSFVGVLSAPASPSSEKSGASQEHEQRQQQQQSYGVTSKLVAGLPGVTPLDGGPPPGLTAQQQIQLAATKVPDEKNKRKALVSPEYVQYGNPVSTIIPGNHGSTQMDSVQYATKVPEPTGRRPFKKSLHHTTIPDIGAELQHQHQVMPAPTTPSLGDDDVRCKCTGKCRNARCACVKAGLVCGAQCKCVSCANPFVPMAREGIDIQLMVRDICLMQYLSKVKDMQELLDSTVSYECCDGGGGVVQVKHTVENGFACPHCGAHFTYSWCNNRLCPDAKKPRRHCAKCRRCGDHRNQHCDLCNHCYFAGVANSFRCSCQSSGGSGVKSRAVVPNPVRRDPEPGLGSSTAKYAEGDQQTSNVQLFGAINPAVDGGSMHDENIDANDSSKRNAEDEADDSCKMQ